MLPASDSILGKFSKSLDEHGCPRTELLLGFLRPDFLIEYSSGNKIKEIFKKNLARKTPTKTDTNAHYRTFYSSIDLSGEQSTYQLISIFFRNEQFALGKLGKIPCVRDFIWVRQSSDGVGLSLSYIVYSL